MEKKKVFGGRIRQDRRDADMARATLQRRIADDEKAQPNRDMAPETFKPLHVRAKRIVDATESITAGAPEVRSPHTGELRRKVVVVIGKHPKMKETPDHTILCGVTLIKYDDILAYPERTKAEIAFAIVPTVDVAKYAGQDGDPHALNSPNNPKNKLFDPEVSPSDVNLDEAMDRYVKARSIADQEGVLASARGAIEEAEKSWGMIYEALENPHLNPHISFGVQQAV